ncbi:hypothetical protein JCM8097_002790 [Rhodosporidiobolus ruineniae]
MSALFDSLDALRDRLATLQSAHTPATAAQLDAARTAFVQLARRAAAAGAWEAVEDVERDVEAIMSGLNEALEAVSRTRASTDELPDEKPVLVRPRRAGTAATSDEDGTDSDDVSASPPPKRRRTGRYLLSNSPTPSNNPRLPPFPTLFDLDPHDHPTLPVSDELLDPDTDRPIFEGGFERQRRAKLRSAAALQALRRCGYDSWNEIGGNSRDSFIWPNTLCLLGDKNILPPPSQPGAPVVTAMPPERLASYSGHAMCILGGINAVWHYYGDYVVSKRFAVTGAELKELEGQEREAWVRYWARREASIEDAAAELSKARLANGLVKMEELSKLGDEPVEHFAIWHCLAFDEEKMGRMVRKRALRLKIEAGEEPSVEEYKRVQQEDEEWQKKKREAEDKKERALDREARAREKEYEKLYKLWRRSV